MDIDIYPKSGLLCIWGVGWFFRLLFFMWFAIECISFLNWVYFISAIFKQFSHGVLGFNYTQVENIGPHINGIFAMILVLSLNLDLIAIEVPRKVQ